MVFKDIPAEYRL